MNLLKEIIVFDMAEYDEEWPPKELEGCIAWLQAKLEIIPPKYRKTAQIEFDSVENFGGSYARIRIHYLRPETAEELEARERQEKAVQSRIRARELKQLAELKAKYENQN